jgi:hypothetical protein
MGWGFITHTSRKRIDQTAAGFKSALYIQQSAMSAQLACVPPLSTTDTFLAAIVHEAYLMLKLPIDVSLFVHMSKWILARSGSPLAMSISQFFQCFGRSKVREILPRSS